jgi:hypothetical protein
MDNGDGNSYDPNSLPVWDEETNGLCESYAQELLERAVAQRREIARDHPDDSRHLKAATQLSRLAVDASPGRIAT